MKFGAGMRNLGVVGNGDLRTGGLGTGDLGSGDLGSGDLSSADTLGRLGGVLVLSRASRESEGRCNGSGSENECNGYFDLNHVEY
jgi:hypothetical protein